MSDRLSRGRSVVLAAVGMALLLCGGGSAARADEPAFEVRIPEPDRGDLLAGSVVLRAEVRAPAGISVVEVAFFVDGARLGSDAEPPYEMTWKGIDPLQDHLLRVTAVSAEGPRAYDLLSIPILGMVSRVSVTGRAPDFVLLDVTFLDHQDQPVVDVKRDEVRVYEQGRRQEIEVFRVDDRPLAVELLLDSSDSTQPVWAELAQSTHLFAKTLREGDRAAVEAFSDLIFEIAPLGSTHERIESGISRFEDWGGATNLYDALSRAALYTLGRADTDRRALLVLTDTGDWGSMLTDEDAEAYLQRAEVEVHSIVWYPSNLTLTGSQRKFSDSATFHKVMKRITTVTGGDQYDTADVPMPEIFVRIGERLRAQYLVGYTSTSKRPPGEEREIEIRLKRPGSCRARTRRAHYGGESLVDFVAAQMTDGPEERRLVAVRAASMSQDPVALRALVQALAQGEELTDPVPLEARMALLSLGASAVPYLRMALDGEDQLARQRAARVLIDLFVMLQRAGGAAGLDEAVTLLGQGDRRNGVATLRRLAARDLPDPAPRRLAQILELLEGS